MPSEPQTKDFFISYTSADSAWADWIAFQLRDAGYSTIHQAWDFRPGSNFIVDMSDALENSESTIAVYSSNYFQSGFSQDEWTAAFADRSLIPIRVRACEIPKLLKPRVYIDLVDLNEQAARNTLLLGLKREGPVPTTAPAFPPRKKRFPGALPEIFEVPLRRNPNFTGRDQMLDDLHASLRSGGKAALTAIAGMGGVGKTSLALEYSYRFASDYSLIWWLRAEDPSTLASDYARLAQKLNLREKDSTNQAEVLSAVRDWLTHNTGWLLVFDNAVDPPSLAAYLPHANTGHALITSRYQSWRGVAEPLSVQRLSRAESIAFLHKRTARNEPAAAESLSDLLGDLPLALGQAAGYIDSNAISIAKYVELYTSYPKDTLEIGATWKISFDQLKAQNPAALDLLNLIAFLAPDNIPRDLLRPTPPNPVAFNKSIESLRRYSLIEVGEESFSVHRLLQQIIRDGLDDSQQRHWVEKAVVLLHRVFPEPYDHKSWPLCSTLVAHAIETATHAERVHAGLEWAAMLLSNAGLFLWLLGRHSEAKPLVQRALIVSKSIRGSNHFTISSTHLIVSTLKAESDFDGVLKDRQNALALAENTFGPDHPNVAHSASAISSLLLIKGNLTEALQYLYRALNISQTVYGPHHPETQMITQSVRFIESERAKRS